MSFKEAYQDYEIYAQRRHKKQGFYTIRQNFKLHILPYFENIEDIKKLEKKDIINWQNKILGKNFSDNFNRNLYYEFSAFLKYCVYSSYIEKNIILEIEKFKKKYDQKEHNVYNLFQFLKFRFFLEGYVYKQYFNIIFKYGPRPGETMAFRFEDLHGKILDVKHNINRKGNRELVSPKNHASKRKLKISWLTRFRLWRLKRIYTKKYGVFSNDYFIFGGKKPLSPTTIDRRRKIACQKAKLFSITQHEFRHSYATRLIHRRVPIDVVSRSMGHSKVSMTVDVYLHQEKKNNIYSFNRF